MEKNINRYLMIECRNHITYLLVIAVLLFGVLNCQTVGTTLQITASMEGKDLSPMIRTTLERNPSQPLNLTLARGKFFLSENIQLPGGSRLVGAGRGATVLESAAGVVLLVADVSEVVISDFTLKSDGGHSSVEVRSGTYREKKSARPIRNVRIENIRIDNNANTTKGRHGISIRAWANEDVSDIVIRNCSVTGAWGRDINFGLDNCYLASYDSDGTGSVHDVLVEGCDFDLAGRQNLSVAGKGAGKPYNITIRNCSFKNSTLAGIDLEEARAVKIEGCSFEDNGLCTTYFDLGSRNNAMRSALVAHNSEAAVSDCTFRNAFIGYAAVHKESGGMHLTDCHFTDAPVANGNFAGFGETEFNNCSFTGSNRPVVKMYRGRFQFTDCRFSGSAESLIELAGGGTSKREHEIAGFTNCEFTGSGSTTAILANYEFLVFEGCKFQTFSNLFSTSGINRWNTLKLLNANVSDVGSIGEFPYQSLEYLKIENSHLELSKGGLTSPTVNGVFELNGNDIKLANKTAALVKSKQFRKVVLKGNTISQEVATMPLIDLTTQADGEVHIIDNVLPEKSREVSLIKIAGRGKIPLGKTTIGGNKSLSGKSVDPDLFGTLKKN
ncbi:hypothetical protein FUA23_03915 [Neolewinella aurantiaca]|uniref:Right handed beta helix domain-containing protein n=1 Tax=Neolewinella aurantiaca TaxID=2602767 RepID=A0A5C7G024_9BACT|nr:right-handed parallel beta-helix repeat-containing protein [Neolewinella aurantiaca]TXF90956.1 hypothetical protein FUA23_03915 [Neolewinella aurantiaca]